MSTLFNKCIYFSYRMISVTCLISGLMIHLSSDIFIDTYGKSQEQVFERMGQELNAFHENLLMFLNRMDASWTFRSYFNHQNEMDDIARFQTIYQMKKDIKKALPSNLNGISILVLNQKGESFLNQDELLTTSAQEILNSSITKRALEQKNTIVYESLPHGFTSSTQSTRVIMATKVLCDSSTQKPYAIVYISIKESEFKKFYEYFVSEYTHCYFVNEKEQVVVSDQTQEIGSTWSWLDKERLENKTRSIEEKDGKKVILLQKTLPYYQYTAYGVIDANQALEKLYDIPKLIVISCGIGSILLLIVFCIVKQTTRSLSILIQKMSVARENGFRQKLPMCGVKEVQELTATYNVMLDDIETYISQLIETQKEKRRAEIRALQMQINPHYVYNTLTSIKWLIWQGDTKTSVQALDAFIRLLRNTIGNEDEFILLSDEIENLQNYVLINQIRYGNQIEVQYQIEDACKSYYVPKLILQPFVENAFFHGYPSGQRGVIQVLAKLEQETLRIKIVDDGVGISGEALEKLTSHKKKTEHFTGIGIQNVRERLHLLYGEHSGVQINSKEQQGTEVIIQIPIKVQIEIEKKPLP